MDIEAMNKPLSPSSVHVSNLEPRPRRMHVGTAIWLAFTTAMALSGMIMGAWATWWVKSWWSDPMLVRSPNDVAGGYVLSTHIFAGSGYWNSKRAMMYSRSDHGVYAINSSVYIFGGLTNPGTNSTTGKVLNNVVKYDTYLGTVEELVGMTEPRYRFAYGALGSKLYIFGGFSNYDDGTAQAARSTMVVDLVTGARQLLPASSNLNVDRVDLCGTAANGKLYAAGGYNPTDFSPLNTVEEFDPATGKWTLLTNANMSSARGDCKAGAIGNNVYIMGGVIYTQPAGVDCNANWEQCYVFSKTVDQYNTVTRTMRRRADMVNARGDFAVESFGSGRLVVAGGEGTTGERNEIATPWVEQYNEQYDIWIPKAPLPEARFRFDMAYVSGALYAFGGHPTCDRNVPCFDEGLNTVFAFSDVDHPDVWVTVPKGN